MPLSPILAGITAISIAALAADSVPRVIQEGDANDLYPISDGSIVAAALPSPFTDVSPFLAFLSPDGKTKHIVRTGVYFPYHLVVADDGTVWTLGHEMIQGNAKDPALDPNAGILRQFSRSGSPMASALPQSNFRASREESRIL